MKALLYQGDKKLSLTQIPEPEGEFIVRVKACTICGTDLKTYLHGHPNFKPPCILGHEFIGSVEKAPAGCGYFKGDCVVVAPYGECNKCENCLHGSKELCNNKRRISSGAFCELVSIPEDFIEDGVIKLASADEVFTLTEPLACVLTAMEKMNLSENSNVLIAGGGPMGVLFALSLSARNISVTLSEPIKDRREMAENLGLKTISPEDAKAKDYDNIVVAVNVPELAELYINEIADGGTVHLFAGLPAQTKLSIDASSIHYRGVTIVGSSGFHLSAFHEAYEIISNNKEHFRRLITHRFGIDEAIKAFETLAAGLAFKVCIMP
ncbi:MAG: alcohol dehydrogenase catalytic domain-containing protein [Lachnospiraceae bacterium]|jgi:L-iditol 2-dehydrogenase|nr:alcohol dehydrogenase catalytic domain-containing protein [Lachnospiraceae bacterium]